MSTPNSSVSQAATNLLAAAPTPPRPDTLALNDVVNRMLDHINVYTVAALKAQRMHKPDQAVMYNVKIEAVIALAEDLDILSAIDGYVTGHVAMQPQR